MNPKNSPLILIDFAIINSNFKFNTPPAEINIREIVQSYELDIDFGIFQEPDFTRVFIKSSINFGQEIKPGYSIFAEGVAVFQLSKEASLSEENKKSLLQFSTVSIALNSLRGFISTLTSAAPLGRYILPSIDINDLFKQKAQSMPHDQPKKKKK